MIKQSVINTFNRVGIKHENFDNTLKCVKVNNRFGGGSCETTVLISELISWVYDISNAYEMGDYSVKVSDFDRIRYFVLAEDRNAYSVCLD
jgi:hypothetical protein